MSRRMRNSLLVVGLSLGLALAPTSAASAHGGDHHSAEVTRGSFVTLAGGTPYLLQGHAVMVRVGDRTMVGVHIRGLDGSTVYPTHVHNKRCAAPDFGGSHYQHQVGGDVDALNEIWPTVRTNDRGNGLGFAAHAHRARSEAMSIVIHQAGTNTRLACADLS